MKFTPAALMSTRICPGPGTRRGLLAQPQHLGTA